MRSLHRRSLVLLVLAAFLNACAYGTLIRGAKQGVTFNSKPSEAQVSINGQEIGETPVVWNLSRKKGYLVEFDKEGCEGKQMTLENSLSPIVFATL